MAENEDEWWTQQLDSLSEGQTWEVARELGLLQELESLPSESASSTSPPPPRSRGRPGAASASSSKPSRRKANAVAASWAMTWNNWEEHCEDAETTIRQLPQLCVAVVGKEVAPTTGTPHLQGFLRFTKPKCWTWLCQRLPGARLEPCNNDKAMQKYCRKDGDLLLDVDLRFGRDIKKKLEESSFLAALQGDPSQLLQEASPSWTFQNLSRVRMAMSYGPQLLTPCTSRTQPYVVWLFGPAGTFKTQFVRSLLKSACLEGKSSFFLSAPDERGKVWWDGLSRATDIVVMDDLRPYTLSSGIWCQIISSLPWKADCKCITVDFCASLVVVTAPDPPWRFWPQRAGDGEVAPQVVRRVSLCAEFLAPPSSWNVTTTSPTCSSFVIPPPGGVAGDPWATTRMFESYVKPAVPEGEMWARARARARTQDKPEIVKHWGDPPPPPLDRLMYEFEELARVWVPPDLVQEEDPE